MSVNIGPNSKQFNRSVPHDAIYQNFTNSFTPLIKGVARMLTLLTKPTTEPLSQNEKYYMGFNHFLMFVTFRYRGLHHLDLYCTLINEVWL